MIKDLNVLCLGNMWVWANFVNMWRALVFVVVKQVPKSPIRGKFPDLLANERPWLWVELHHRQCERQPCPVSWYPSDTWHTAQTVTLRIRIINFSEHLLPPTSDHGHRQGQHDDIRHPWQPPQQGKKSKNLDQNTCPPSSFIMCVVVI